MITPEQITKLRTEAGLSPTPTNENTGDLLSKRKAALGIVDPAPIVAPKQVTSFTGVPKTGMGETQALPDENTPSTLDIVKNTGKSLVTGTIESGKDIAAAIGGNTMFEKFNALPESDQHFLSTIIQLRNKAATNKDEKLTAHYQDMVKNYKTSDGQSISEVFPALNKSTEQVLGDFASMALETLGGGDLATTGAEKAVALGEKGGLPLAQRLIQGSMTGGKYGTLFGVTGAMQNNGSPTDIVKSGAIGGVTGAILGAGTEGMFGKRVTEGAAAAEAKTVDNVVGRIIQGDAKDIPAATKALTEIDTKGIKTYKDLFTKLDDRVSALSHAQDTHLNGVNPTAIPMDKLVVTTKVGDQEVTHNFINDALTQLNHFYEKTNDVAGKAEIGQLTEKATSGGLSLKDINDIARLHGTEMSGYNVNGELASGLTKQAAENTRAGLKATVRQLAGDQGGKASGAIDKSISDTIRTRDLVGEVQSKVNDLQQKIKERTLGEKAGRLFSQIVNTLGLNTPKGAIEYFLGRGTGLKTLNALDLEKGLQEGLKAINSLINTDTENSFIKEAQSFLKDTVKGTGKKLLNDSRNIQSKEGGFIKIGGKDFAQIPDATKREMMNVIDYLRSGKTNASIEDTVSRLTEKYNINQDWSNDKIANAFEDLIDKTKTL